MKADLSKATARPWVKDYASTIGHIKSVPPNHGTSTPTICRYDTCAPSVPQVEREANAILIVEAVNSYDTAQKLAEAVLALCPVSHGSGPAAPCFDEFDYEVENKRGEWSVIDGKEWENLRTLAREFQKAGGE